MQPNTDLLSDAAFFQQAADFLDMNSFTPTSLPFNESSMLAIPEISEAMSNNSSPTNTLSSDTSERDHAIIALRAHREKEKLRRRKQRQRIKDELESLRRKEDELSQKLKNLKLRKETRLSSGDKHSIWKVAALMQRGERLQSETEHRRLITTVKVQASYIENLRGLFQNSTTFRNTLQGSVVCNTTENQLGASDIPLFTSLLQKIDACYERFDDILNECGVVTMPLGITNSAHWRDKNGELEFYQNLHKFELPFDMEKTQQSCWRTFNFQQHQCDRKVYSGFGSAENIVALKYRMVRTLGSGMTASVVQRVVARRFIEKIVLCIFGICIRKAREYFVGCIQTRPDGVACDHC